MPAQHPQQGVPLLGGQGVSDEDNPPVFQALVAQSIDITVGRTMTSRHREVRSVREVCKKERSGYIVLQRHGGHDGLKFIAPRMRISQYITPSMLRSNEFDRATRPRFLCARNSPKAKPVQYYEYEYHINRYTNNCWLEEFNRSDSIAPMSATPTLG